MKKVPLFLLLAFSFSFTSYAESSLKITEVMYDFPGTDDGHEYIKIENTGSESVDITGYKFIDGGSATKHGINVPPKNGGVGSPVIEPGGFVILADNAVTYIADNPDFSGSVLDSTFSLNNDGGTVELLDKDSNIAASFSYPVEVVADPEPPAEEDPPAEDVSPPDEEAPAESGVEVQAEVQPEPINLILNEIMYDLPGTDDGREWIEIYNAGTGDVDLTSLKLFEEGTNHGITDTGNKTIPPGGFAIIASDPTKFVADWPEFQGLIFDSTFSLSNTGEDIALKDAEGNIIDQISYSLEDGAAGNERSLQLYGSGLIEALPTPGLPNKSVAEPPQETSDSSGANSQSSDSGRGNGSSEAKPKAPPKTPKIVLKITAPDYAITNSDFVLSASGQPGKYVWNFGNGEVIEKNDGDQFSYNYQFPGAYMITLIYFADEKSKPVKTTAKIKVDENPINISEILSDGSVEIRNKATHQMDLSGWTLEAGGTRFTLPPETVMIASGHIVLPAKITKFMPASKDVELFYPSGISAFKFGATSEKEKIDKNTKKIEPKISEEVQPPESAPENRIVKGAELSASAVSSIPENNTQPLFPWMLGLGVIITLSSILSFSLYSKAAQSAAGFVLKDD
jgi:hypothetical protein